jgi:signal transduction histidine kinase
LGNLAETLHGVARQLVREILSQRTLAAAETGELEVEPVFLTSMQVLREEVESLHGCPAYRDRRLEIDAASGDLPMTSDRALLGRVLDNMLRNAIEATLPGGTVEAGCRAAGEQVEFWVRNPGEMPLQARLQVFQRSFSTKGSGRGLGAYSMKLLTEHYLGGTVSFHSSPEGGTVFQARYPRCPRC